MTYSISSNRKTLTVKASAVERGLIKDAQAPDSDDTLRDFFEHLVCNSELQWIDSADTGDLTSAPILGILGEDQPTHGLTPSGPYGYISTGPGMFQPILERWGFMDYALRSPLKDLMDKGEAVFVAEA